MCDLITSTKNEKIFQESIGLAIRLLDGGNTEIQVCGGGASGARRIACQALRPCGRASSPREQCESDYSEALPPVSALCHVAVFHPTPLPCSILGLLPTISAPITSTVLAFQPLPRPPSLPSHMLFSLWYPTKTLLSPEARCDGLISVHLFLHSFF